MYRLLATVLIITSLSVKAQDKKTLDSIDKVIIGTIIEPAEQQAGDNDPAWGMIGEKIKASYSEVQTDRALTKAQIYYYFGKDWPKFNSALVHYTEAYEDKNDAKLMNKNANFILQHSDDPKELSTAKSWADHAVKKDPDNKDYKTTLDALDAKIKAGK